MSYSIILQNHKKTLEEQLEKTNDRIRINALVGDEFAKTIEQVQKETIETYILKKFNRLFPTNNHSKRQIIEQYLKELETAKTLNKYPARVNQIITSTPLNAQPQIKQKYLSTIDYAITDLKQKATPISFQAPI